MKKGRWIPLLAGVIALLVIAGIASASQASHKPRALAGPFCISKKTGVVRKVAPKRACHKGEIRKVGFAVKGLRGPAGATGPQGPAGATGAQGLVGATGATGATGLQGLPGPQGDVGPQGAQGVQGAQGDQGPQGLAGVPGLSSITPVSADQTCTAGGWLMQDWEGEFYEICNGTNGADGQDGATGPQGPQGIQGLQGDPGLNGADGVSAIQTVTCENGTAGVDVTTPGGVFRLCDGQTGPQGPTGDIGPQGLQGDVGPQGLQGDIGPQGPQGDIGPQGLQGPVGPQGDPGATGPQGPAGPQGSAGTTAIYNAAGTSQASAHIVEGTATTNNGGNASVTFAGAAVFSSTTSYTCTVTAESNGSPVTSGTHISSKATTGFSFKSTLNNTTFDYICVGN